MARRERTLSCPTSTSLPRLKRCKRIDLSPRSWLRIQRSSWCVMPRIPIAPTPPMFRKSRASPIILPCSKRRELVRNWPPSPGCRLLPDIPLEHAQRHRALAQNPLVELADVEPGAEALLRELAQLHDPQAAHLVRQRLGGD